MKILFLGDVVGRSGRKKVFSNIDNIVSKFKIDFVIVNAENSAHGFGINPTIASKFFNHQIDVLTTGDHIWDQMTIKPYLQEELRILRPANYNKFNDGEGYRVFSTRNNKKVLVINLLGNLFIERENLENPFLKADEILKKYKLGKNVDAIFMTPNMLNTYVAEDTIEHLKAYAAKTAEMQKKPSNRPFCSFCRSSPLAETGKICIITQNDHVTQYIRL